MNKQTIRGFIVLAVLLAVFSVVAFVVPFVHNGVFWIGYCFGVLALGLQVYVFKVSLGGEGTAKSRFYGFPVARVGVIYLVAQLIASFAEMALARVLPPWVAVVVNLLLAAAAIIGCVTVETMRDEIVRQDGQLKADVTNMRQLQSLSAALPGQCNDPALKPALQKLADEFRYSDPVSSENTRALEGDMRAQLADIQQALVDGDGEAARKLCAKLTATLAERNRVCSVSK